MMHYFGICIILAQAMKPGLLATICVLYRMMPVDPHTVIPAEQSLAACLSKAPVTPPGPRPAPSYLGPLPINCGVAAAMPPPTPPLRSGNWIWSPPPPPPPPPLDQGSEATAAAIWWLQVGRFGPGTGPKAKAYPQTTTMMRPLPAGFGSSMLQDQIGDHMVRSQPTSSRIKFKNNSGAFDDSEGQGQA